MTFNLEAGIRRARPAKLACDAAIARMRDRSSIWIGLADLLLCVLSVVIVAVAPKEQAQSGVPEKAEYLMSAEWNVNIDADVDIWMIPPTKKPVFYGSRDVGCARLDSDNRGFMDDVVTLADGTKVKVDSDKETISLRCIEPGHYDVGVSLYATAGTGGYRAARCRGRASRFTSRSSRSIPR